MFWGMIFLFIFPLRGLEMGLLPVGMLIFQKEGDIRVSVGSLSRLRTKEGFCEISVPVAGKGVVSVLEGMMRLRMDSKDIFLRKGESILIGYE